MRACAIVPAYEAENTVGDVVRELRRLWPSSSTTPVLVVDDGSGDGTASVARAAGAWVVSHPENRGKGVALRTGMAIARSAGFEAAVSVDADGQHPAVEAVRLLASDPDPEALVLGIRDLRAARAPIANQLSNRFSNAVLSLFAGRRLADTQCGLRRYPIERTLELGGRGEGYDFEAEILLLAVAAGVRIVETAVRVVYPPLGQRTTHFHSVRDPARIVVRVVGTTLATRFGRRPAVAASQRTGPGGSLEPGASATRSGGASKRRGGVAHDTPVPRDEGQG